MAIDSILIVGAPASGKTCLRQSICAMLHSKGVSLDNFSIEDIHREQLPPDQTSDDYSYNENGALILLKPDVLVPKAVSAFIDRCLAAKQRQGFLAEIAHSNPSEIMNDLLTEGVLDGTLVVHVIAEVAIRQQRNANRTRGWIPDHVVVSYPADFEQYLMYATILPKTAFLTIVNNHEIDYIVSIGCSISCFLIEGQRQ